MQSNWNLQSYLNFIEVQIKNILARPEKEKLTYDILDNIISQKDKLIALRVKHRTMKIGDIWQMVLGNYNSFEDLGTGHKTGLDIVSHSRKIIAEVKTRTNTDNASSRKANKDKLACYKKAYPEYECIYAMVNSNTEQKTKKGSVKIIQHNGVEIKEYIGIDHLLRYIFGSDTDVIIDFVQKTIYEYDLTIQQGLQ